MILFLDDDAERTRIFSRIIPYATTTETAQGMIDLLSALGDTIPELVFLDHDLGGKQYVDSAEKETGMEVVRWIVANKPKIDSIIVHSHNHSAGQSMTYKLQEAGYEVDYIPFSMLISDGIIKPIVKPDKKS